MSVLLLAGLLASVVTLTTVSVFCLRGEFRRAGQAIFRWGIGLAVYTAIIMVTALNPREAPLKIGAPYCDDDMCVSVESVTRMPQQDASSYRLGIRLFTRANHRPRSTN